MHSIRMTRPEDALDELFSLHVKSPLDMPHIGAERAFSRAEIAAVCDVYDSNRNQALEMTDGKAASYKDFRKVLERKDIDAVLISTPDHWHALPAIDACDAGKDLYVEKPLSHTAEAQRDVV